MTEHCGQRAKVFTRRGLWLKGKLVRVYLLYTQCVVCKQVLMSVEDLSHDLLRLPNRFDLSNRLSYALGSQIQTPSNCSRLLAPTQAGNVE